MTPRNSVLIAAGLVGLGVVVRLSAQAPAATGPVAPQTQVSVAQRAAPPQGNAVNGRKLFVSIGCYACHGFEAQGTVAGPRLGPRPLVLANFLKYVRRPTNQMPPYSQKVATDAELTDIYAFLQSLPEPQPVERIPLLK